MSVPRYTEEWLAKRLGSAYETQYALSVPKTGVISLSLPWPPTLNTNIRHGKNGHYKTDEYKAFIRIVAQIVFAHGTHRRPMPGKLRVLVQATPPDKRKRDLDNIVKPIFDALAKAGLYEDDSNIDDFRVMRFAGVPGVVNVFVETIK